MTASQAVDASSILAGRIVAVGVVSRGTQGTRVRFVRSKLAGSEQRRIPGTCIRIKLSGILPIDSAARSVTENGNTGSPRTAQLAKRRFEPKISLAMTFFAKGHCLKTVKVRKIPRSRIPKILQ